MNMHMECESIEEVTFSTCGSLIVTLGATTSDACVDILFKLETRTDSQLEIKMYLLKGQFTPKM